MSPEAAQYLVDLENTGAPSDVVSAATQLIRASWNDEYIDPELTSVVSKWQARQYQQDRYGK